MTAAQRKMLKQNQPRFANDYKEFRMRQIDVDETGLGRISATEEDKFIYCG